MPPVSKKDCSVILFDLAAQNQAKQALIKICCNSFFTKPKNLTKLILLNSKDTENRLHSRKGGFSNINEVAEDISLYNPQHLYEMVVNNSETAQANWLEGLLVALTSLKEDFEDIGGIVTHQLLFLTDLKSPLGKYNKDIVDKIVKYMNDFNCYLYIVGPNVEPPFMIKNEMDVKEWMKNLKVDPNNENLTVLKTIISQTDHTIVCNYKMGVHLFFAVKRWAGTQPWQVPLEIGSKIQIPAMTMKVLNSELKCKLTKAQGSFGYPTWIDAEDETIEIDPSEVISGVMRHEKFVQLPEQKMFQVENPRGFNVLSFTDSEKVPEYLMRGGGCYRVVSKSTEEDSQVFNILVDRLAEQNKYVIARRIYNRNFNPKIVVLVPKPKSNPKSFLFTSLPFGDNLKVNYVERDPNLAPKVETHDEIYGFLDSMDVDSEKSIKRLSLGVNMLQNVNTQRIINKVADKMFGQHMALHELDFDLLEESNGSSVQTLKKLWVERTREDKETKDAGGVESDEEFDWDS